MIETNKTSKIGHKLAIAIQTHLGFDDPDRSLKEGEPRQASLKTQKRTRSKAC
jgi:hypothetical protein